mmetsp:Transcript_28184/g.90618  ORF Transcript_28184/g.90618 Transcript_28184/m.90618 type:complete len:329 (-) Transcript_28184:61-1047(-)
MPPRVAKVACGVVLSPLLGKDRLALEPRLSLVGVVDVPIAVVARERIRSRPQVVGLVRRAVLGEAATVPREPVEAVHDVGRRFVHRLRLARLGDGHDGRVQAELVEDLVVPLLVVCDRRGGTRVGRHALALQQRIEVRIVVLEEGYDRVESVSIPKVECDPLCRGDLLARQLLGRRRCLTRPSALLARLELGRARRRTQIEVERGCARVRLDDGVRVHLDLHRVGQHNFISHISDGEAARLGVEGEGEARRAVARVVDSNKPHLDGVLAPVRRHGSERLHELWRRLVGLAGSLAPPVVERVIVVVVAADRVATAALRVLLVHTAQGGK